MRVQVVGVNVARQNRLAQNLHRARFPGWKIRLIAKLSNAAVLRILAAMPHSAPSHSPAPLWDPHQRDLFK
jgi:hypothetical protein